MIGQLAAMVFASLLGGHNPSCGSRWIFHCDCPRYQHGCAVYRGYNAMIFSGTAGINLGINNAALKLAGGHWELCADKDTPRTRPASRKRRVGSPTIQHKRSPADEDYLQLHKMAEDLYIATSRDAEVFRAALLIPEVRKKIEAVLGPNLTNVKLQRMRTKSQAEALYWYQYMQGLEQLRQNSLRSTPQGEHMR